MTPAELEHYLNEGIPLTRALQIRVAEVTAERLVLQAPLTPNINQHATVFGGSAAAVAILAAWSLLHTRLLAAQLPAAIVIQRSNLDYLRPIGADFSAVATLPPASDWTAFTRLLARRGKARLTVEATLECLGEVVARFSGEFVALRDQLH